MDNAKLKQAFDSVPEIPARTYKAGDEILFDHTRLNDSNFKKMLLYFDSISASPIEFLMTGILSVLSGAAGKNFYFKITDSMNIYLNVWGVIIGPSSITRKTTAINLTKQEFERISTKMASEFKQIYNEYLKELSEAKDKKKQFEKPVPIRKYYIFPQDSTIESLAEILANSDRGLIVHSEFGSFLQQLNRSYAGDSKQFLTHIYDVPESYEISRATKQNTLILRPFVSILGASTIDWVRENSTPSDLRTGFLARFIYSIRNKPDEHKSKIPLLRLKHLSSQSKYYISTRSIYDYLLSSESKVEMKVDKKAEELHCEYDIGSYDEMMSCENKDELSFKARLVVYALKIAGLIALTEKRTKVSYKDMQDGILLTDYYKRNVEQLLNRELNQTEFSRQEKRILEVIRAKGGQIQHSDLMRLSNFKKKELDEIISNLSDKEQILKREQKNSQNKLVTFYQLPGFSSQSSKHNENQSELIEQVRDEFYKGFGHTPNEYELEAALSYVNQFGISMLQSSMKECALRKFRSWKSFHRNIDSNGKVKPIKIKANRFDDDDDIYSKPYVR